MMKIRGLLFHVYFTIPPVEEVLSEAREPVEGDAVYDCFVIANNAEEALRLAKEAFGKTIEALHSHNDGVSVSTRREPSWVLIGESERETGA